MVYMKLLVNIDDDLFSEVRKLTKAKTKKDTIVIPMREYLEMHKRKKLAELIGNFDAGTSLNELLRQRKKWKNS